MKVLCNNDNCPELTNKIYDSEIDINICCAWCPYLSECIKKEDSYICAVFKENNYDANNCIQCPDAEFINY